MVSSLRQPILQQPGPPARLPLTFPSLATFLAAPSSHRTYWTPAVPAFPQLLGAPRISPEKKISQFLSSMDNKEAKQGWVSRLLNLMGIIKAKWGWAIYRVGRRLPEHDSSWETFKWR